MDKARLDWVISGLSQYALTKAEEVFLKTASEDFDRNQALTEKQEERMEVLYKQKSQMIPNKNRSAPCFFRREPSRSFRTLKEERVMRAELRGYEAYIARVKHRLIPHVW